MKGLENAEAKGPEANYNATNVEGNAVASTPNPSPGPSPAPESQAPQGQQRQAPEGRPRREVNVSDEEALSQLPEEVRASLGLDLEKMSEDDLYKLVDQLRDFIIKIKESRSQLINEVKSLREQRRSLIDQKRSIVEQLTKLREQRKSLLDELAKLKQERDSLLKELRAKVEQLKEARQLLEKEGNIAKLSLRRVQKRIEELEWKQQTSVLPPQEEKRLVEEIQRLEELAERIRKARQEEISIMELEAEVKSLRMRLNEVVNKLKEISSNIGNLKSQIASLTPKIDELNKQIDSLKSLIDTKGRSIDVATKQLDLLYDKYRKAMMRLRELKVSKQRGLQLSVLEEKRKQVEEKAKRGEALTLDELRILYGEFDL